MQKTFETNTTCNISSFQAFFLVAQHPPDSTTKVAFPAKAMSQPKRNAVRHQVPMGKGKLWETLSPTSKFGISQRPKVISKVFNYFLFVLLHIELIYFVSYFIIGWIKWPYIRLLDGPFWLCNTELGVSARPLKLHPL